MTHDWPGRWHSKTEESSEQTGVTFTNDHGIRWLSDEGAHKWLRISGKIPENRC